MTRHDRSGWDRDWGRPGKRLRPELEHVDPRLRSFGSYSARIASRWDHSGNWWRKAPHRAQKATQSLKTRHRR